MKRFSLVFPPSTEQPPPTLDIHQLRLEHWQRLDLWNKSKDAMLEINQEILWLETKKILKIYENKHRNVAAVCIQICQTQKPFKAYRGVSLLLLLFVILLSSPTHLGL